MRRFCHVCGVLVLVLFHSVARAQRGGDGPADRVCAKLRLDVDSVMPAGVEGSVSLQDDRVYSVHVEVQKHADLAKLLRGIQVKDRRGALDVWSERLNRNVHAMVVAAVRASGHDPGFNPGTDVRLVVCGHVLPVDEEGKDFYWASFTGTRRDPADATDAAGAPPAEAPNGAELSVSIMPDRLLWKPREKITGKLKISNTGKGRTHCYAWGLDSLVVTDKAGKPADRFSFDGCILPAPNAPMYTFLEQGEVRSMSFEISTDRLDDLRGGFLLGEGEWVLTYDSRAFANTLVKVQPVTFRVLAEPGTYKGPRISAMRGCGPNLLLVREDNWIEVVDGGTAARLGTRRPEGFISGSIWNGSVLRASSDGRLIAFGTTRDAPVTIEAIFGAAPVIGALAAPRGVQVGPGGFGLERFLAGDQRALCVSNYVVAVVDTRTGELERTRTLEEQWVSTSTDGRFAAWVNADAVRILGNRGEDSYAVRVVDMEGDQKVRTRTITGHGDHPDLEMGARRAYLSDEFQASVVALSLEDGNLLELRTDMPAEVVGETPDASLVVVAWPRHGSDEAKRRPTEVGVFRTSDGARVSTVRCPSACSVALLGSPARIVTARRTFAGSGFGERAWLEERVKVYDTLTGAELRDLDLTPPAGLLPAYPGK